jgi:carboxymethylenebutenolidase
MASNMVTVTTGDGKTLQCYVSQPAKQPAPVIVIVQEIFGITDWLRSFADGLAAQGFLAVVPDLFFRLEAGLKLDDNNEKDLQKAFKYYGEFNQEQGLKDLQDVVKYSRTMAGANGKVGCTGFCLGGLMTYFMACHSDIDCAVSYYGGGINQKLDQAASIKKPIMFHLAQADQYIDGQAQKMISERMAKVANAEVYIYPNMDHAFARIGGHAYNKEAADKAHSRTQEFFKKNLQGAPVSA